MIQIKRNDLPQIAAEFAEHLNAWWVNKTTHQIKYKEWIEKARAGRHDAYAEMLEFYGEKSPGINQISDVKGLRDINLEFYKRFRNEVREWKLAAKRDRRNTSFGQFIEKMTYAYTEFFKSEVEVKGHTMNAGIWLSSRLGIITCPYCNRHYTFTIQPNDKHGPVRPQFDHFLPKSKYPVTALCFYNLVPSCSECNKLKGEGKIAIHPYEDSFDSHGIRFHMKYPFAGKDALVINNGVWHSNIKRLALADLYKEHIDIVDDLLQKALAYQDHYYDTLIASFKGLGMTKNEIDRIVWGTARETAELEKRPFSKLTKDILEQIGKI